MFDQIAFYSSTTRKNVLRALPGLLKHSGVVPLFVWTRGKTLPHPQGGYQTIKRLPSSEQFFFVMVDDSPKKMLGNGAEEYVIMSPTRTYDWILEEVTRCFEQQRALFALVRLFQVPAEESS